MKELVLKFNKDNNLALRELSSFDNKYNLDLFPTDETLFSILKKLIKKNTTLKYKTIYKKTLITKYNIDLHKMIEKEVEDTQILFKNLLNFKEVYLLENINQNIAALYKFCKKIYKENKKINKYNEFLDIKLLDYKFEFKRLKDSTIIIEKKLKEKNNDL